MKYYLEKERFMKSLIDNTDISTILSYKFGDTYQYTLIFEWISINSDGKQNYTASARIYDISKRDAYLINNLNFDVREKGIRSNHGLYKFLRDWVQESIKKYECGMNKFNCEECGFCKE